MGRKRVHILLDEPEESWLLTLMAESDTLSFGGAVRQAIKTHPEFILAQNTRGVTRRRYRNLVERGRNIRRANKRR